MKFNPKKCAVREVGLHCIESTKHMSVQDRLRLLKLFLISVDEKYHESEIPEVLQIVFHLQRADDAQRELFNR